MKEERQRTIADATESVAERIAVLTAVSAAVGPPARVLPNGGGHATATADDTTEEPVGSQPSETGSGRSTHRICPSCDRRYDSKFTLSERQQLVTAESGRSRLCFDHPADRVYVHEPEHATPWDVDSQ